jgi:transcriptional regulator with XRE-family HTH domain
MTPDQIRKLRESYKLSQTQLSELLNVHWTTVSAWERGISVPGQRHSELMQHFRKVAKDKEDREFAKGVLLTVGALAALAFLIRALAPPHKK